MDDQHLLRYSRQIMLPGIDIEGQERLLAARVLLIGLGGLGSPIAMYLAAAGIGHLVLADFDRVDLANLQRQIIHTTASLGRLKVASAVATLQALNPDLRYTPFDRLLTERELFDEVRQADVVVEATDNFAARSRLNEACLAARTPFVSGAAIRMEGQVSVYRLDRPDSPCYRCIYPADDESDERCAETGILGPVAGAIGCIEAIETIKILLDLGRDLGGRLLVFDAREMEWRTLTITRQPDCPACGPYSAA